MGVYCCACPLGDCERLGSRNHRGKRSFKGMIGHLTFLQRKESFRFVWVNAKVDKQRSEVVHASSFCDLRSSLFLMFGTVVAAALPELPSGLVMADSRGEGAFQDSGIMVTTRRAMDSCRRLTICP